MAAPSFQSGQTRVSVDVEQQLPQQPLQQPFKEPQRDEVAELAATRDAYWDNAKAVCMFFVVWAHCMSFGSALAPDEVGAEPVPAMNESNWTTEDSLLYHLDSWTVVSSISLTTFLLSFFVMPTFAFISGHLSSRDIATPRRVRALLQLAMICFIQQLLWAMLQFFIHPGMPLQFFTTSGVHWFLICILFWRLSLPQFMKFHRPLFASIVIGFFGVIADAPVMPLQAFLSFFPFFIAGHMTPRAELQKYRVPAVRAGILSLLALAVVLPPLVLPLAVGEAFDETAMGMFGVVMQTYGCFMNAERCAAWFSLPMRLVYYLLAAFMIPAFLALIPERRVWGLTWAGMVSMYVYLLHMWALFPWILAIQKPTGGLFVLSAFCYAFVVWAVLSTGFARLCCKSCIEPRTDCLIADPEEPESIELPLKERCMTVVTDNRSRETLEK